ncbi:phage replisome organizer N-terminal domain-containing protein [Geobacter anodireducens]|uniref:Phage replisome organizer N-terminal domain-containing protein n=1 Tax=Geobacter anodireducens TaxID=1340425 RepID=A0ABR9NZJ3_9BACT|nr:phage replisome organizer N-terminal domain-containing protein [Geobacter anodireducens]MBE2889659.1 phage replisome organizer N-terminal domain-containing protein [Geobacter anodireducens]
MGDGVFWIRLQTDTFDSETIMLLEAMPDGDTILVIWFKMQILAGKCNADGYLILNGECPYSDEMLATVFRRPLNTVRLAISAFVKFRMVEIIDGAYYLPEWEAHQNIRGLDKIREQTRQRVARHRAKAKGVTLPVTPSNATETEAETEIELEKQQHNVRSLLKDTPLFRITDKELRSLAERHGCKPLMLAADIAAEAWRREKKEISNPGGYLQSLCTSLVVPSWYQSPEVRLAKTQAAEKMRLITKIAQEEKIAAEEKETLDREAYWASISETERDNFRHAAQKSMNPTFGLKDTIISAIAKTMAWNQAQTDYCKNYQNRNTS